MQLSRIGFTALINVIVAASTLLLLNQAVSFSTTSQRLTLVTAHKAEAEQFLQQGIQQFKANQFEAAIQSNKQALAIYRDIGDRIGVGRSLKNLGFVLYKNGQLKEAERTLYDCVKVWESLPQGIDINDVGKMSILVETQANTYRFLQKVLIAQNKSNAALEVSERSRARVFTELFANRADKALKILPFLTPPTIEQIQKIAKAQNSTLVEYSLFYDNLDDPGQSQAQESELFIWVIHSTGEVTFRSQNFNNLWQGEKTTLSEFVNSIRQSLGGTNRYFHTPVNQRFEQLYQVLIQPIADQLPADPEAHVIFIPQQALLMIPFSNLQDASGKYLIEQHTILTSPAITLLNLTHQQRQHIPDSAKEKLVVGNPQPMPQDLRSLPAAEREANAVASIVNTNPITGQFATKAIIVQQMPFSRVIHLATHGLLDESQGLRSAIALAPTSSDNGWLTAKEILDIKLPAELVVLSGCNTGRGRITGDGIIGLSSALISSGVSSVIVSLWSIPDSPTAFLMQEFYHHLLQNPDKAQALRQAMLTTMKQYPNPRDWAAFTLVGETR